MTGVDHAALLEGLEAALGLDGLDRVAQALRDGAAGREPERVHPMQRSNMLHVPGLRSAGWFERADFPWTATAEAATEAITADLAALDAAVPAASYLDGTVGAGTGEGWMAWVLKSEGRYHEDVVAHAPATWALLEQLPMTRGEAFFSVMLPGGTIPMHSGGCNAVLSCHLAIEIPEDGECAMRVGLRTRCWTRGRVCAFDDSFIHTCWNDASQRRVVLVWEVYHPDLTPRERDGLTWLYDHGFNQPV